MSLNQVELNDIVYENLCDYYNMCKIAPVQFHYDQWAKIMKGSGIKEDCTAEQAWKEYWSFKHWYMQMYFGDIVDAAMKITLQPDAFRYYVLRYRMSEGRAQNPGSIPEPVSNIKTSPASNDQEGQDLQNFVQGLTEKEIDPEPFTCFHYSDIVAPCTQQCKFCQDKQSAKNATKAQETAIPAPNSPADDPLQGSAPVKDQELPVFLPGSKIGDPPGFTWCNNEANGGKRCDQLCTPCVNYSEAMDHLTDLTPGSDQSHSK